MSLTSGVRIPAPQYLGGDTNGTGRTAVALNNLLDNQGNQVVPRDAEISIIDPLVGSLPDNAGVRAPQAYRDQSGDQRRGLQSLFSFGKRAVEKNAYNQAHLSASGLLGVVNLAVLDDGGRPIPYAPFEWGGREYRTDAQGVFKLVEKNYFQNSIAAENERMKYVTQMISLVVGQPAQNVIALFGGAFYKALGADQANLATNLYRAYMDQAGIEGNIVARKAAVFARYADAEASPEVMCNFGDNDPEWSRAFNKLSMLIEYHPSAILFDEGPPNPLDTSGELRGDVGANNRGSMEVDGNRTDFARNATAAEAVQRHEFRGGNLVAGEARNNYIPRTGNGRNNVAGQPMVNRG